MLGSSLRYSLNCRACSCAAAQPFRTTYSRKRHSNGSTWQHEFAELNQALDGTDKTHHGEVFAELQRYQAIAANVDRITKRLSDMNTLSPEEHRATKFEQLARALRQRLDEVRRRKSLS